MSYSRRFYFTNYPYIGLICYCLTPLLLLAGYVLIPYAKANESFVYGCLALLSLLGSGLSFKYARRSRTRIVRSLDALIHYTKDHKQPLLLFLREFSTEGSVVPDREYKGDILRALFVSEEDMLAGELNEYGIMVAIGKPSERLPTSGAYRLYVDGGAWKPTVTELITHADTIFLRCGDSGGLSWELEQILEHQRLRSTVFVPLFGDPAKTMRAFRRVQEFSSSSDAAKSPLRSVIDKIAQTEVKDERLKATMGKALRDATEAAELLEAMQDTLDAVGVSAPALAPTLFQVEDGRPVPFDGPFHEAVPKALAHIGIPWKKFSFGRLKAAVGLFLGTSPLLLFGAYQVCQWLDMRPCVAFFEAYGVQIFLGLVAALVVFLSVTL